MRRAVSSGEYTRLQINVAARLECPFVRKVKVSHPAVFSHLEMRRSSYASPRPDRLGRVAIEGRGWVKVDLHS
jgi:hypothetical protein